MEAWMEKYGKKEVSDIARRENLCQARYVYSCFLTLSHALPTEKI